MPHICHVTQSSCSHHHTRTAKRTPKHPPHRLPKAGCSVRHITGDCEAAGVWKKVAWGGVANVGVNIM